MVYIPVTRCMDVYETLAIREAALFKQNYSMKQPLLLRDGLMAAYLCLSSFGMRYYTP